MCRALQPFIRCTQWRTRTTRTPPLLLNASGRREHAALPYRVSPKSVQIKPSSSRSSPGAQRYNASGGWSYAAQHLQQPPCCQQNAPFDGATPCAHFASTRDLAHPPRAHSPPGAPRYDSCARRIRASLRNRTPQTVICARALRTRPIDGRRVPCRLLPCMGLPLARAASCAARVREGSPRAPAVRHVVDGSSQAGKETRGAVPPGGPRVRGARRVLRADSSAPSRSRGKARGCGRCARHRTRGGHAGFAHCAAKGSRRRGSAHSRAVRLGSAGRLYSQVCTAHKRARAIRLWLRANMHANVRKAHRPAPREQRRPFDGRGMREGNYEV